jgi:DNA polymerase-3 subunit epsilon
MQTVAITGITPEMCKQFGMPTQQALRQLLSWANSADVLVAHNGKTFDFPLLRAWAARFSLEMPPKLLLDTRVDIQWPRNYSQKLTYLAAEHGFVNRLAHCAVADVLTMIQILSMQPNLPQILEYAKMPEITIQALVSYDDRDKAKIRGYHWKGETKQWLKVIKEGLLDKEKEGLIDKNIDDDGNETQEIAFTIRQVS